MLPKKKSSFSNLSGVIHLLLLLSLTLILFFTFVIIPKKNVSQVRNSNFVLSDTEDNKSNSGRGSSSQDEDELKPTGTEIDSEDKLGEGKVEEEKEDEIEELEFEDGDDEDEEDEVEELVEGDTEQKVEIKVEDGKVIVKVKTKNRAGEEFEEELEATNSAQIASLKLKVKEGEIKLKVRSQDGKIVLVEEEAEGETLALTDLPLTIDSENNVLTVHTSSGDVNITEFPAQVLSELLSSQNLDKVQSLQLKVKTEDGKAKVIYHAKGEDDVKFLGLFKLEAEVEADVDASTGQTEVVNKPWYLKYLSFLFTQS